jgi:hypothetical protein
MGLFDLYNGLGIIQTKDYIKITCTTENACISEKHLASWMKFFDVSTGHPTPLPGRERFMKTFLSATGNPDPRAQE